MTVQQIQPGETRRCQAGTHVVVLSCELIAGTARYYVETTTGSGQVVHAWTKTYADADQAHTAARRTTLAFRTHGTEQAIAQERHRLTFVNLKALNDRASTARLAAISAQIAAVTDFNTETEIAALAAA